MSQSLFRAARLGLSACALLLGCGSKGEATGSTCPTDSTLTYTNFGKEFFQTNCLACHGSSGPESPKFDTLEQIKSHKSEIDREAAAGPNAVNTDMPDGKSVDEAERRKLGEWLACDAPE